MASVSGGDRLTATLRQISSQVSKAATLEVGFPAGSTEEDGTSTPMVAAIQEFGAPSKGIPPRPFFRSMIKQNAESWPQVLLHLLKSNDYNSADALEILGQQIAAELAQSIVDTNDPPLSPVTVMLRGMRTQKQYRDLSFWKRFAAAKARVAAGKSSYGASVKPLVDTGALIGNIRYTVK